MRKRSLYLLLSLCSLLFSTCREEEFRTGILRFDIEIPEAFTGVIPDNIPIELLNQTTGVLYTARTDSMNTAQIAVTAGSYVIRISTQITKDNTDYLLIGGIPNLYFKADGATESVTLPIKVVQKGRLVIQELYFSGCLRPDGQIKYLLDQYITVANNCHETLYLDGLCIGQIAPPTTVKPSGWMLNTDMSELPLYLMCWQFPGNGTDYPLLPGEKQVIATQAIDHTAGSLGVPASIDLSHVEWAFWNSKLTGSKITAGVKPLHLIWRSGGTSYALTVNGPTVVIFRPESDMTAWAADASHLRKEPGSASPMMYLHIPASWVLDSPNFVSSANTEANSRLPLTMDIKPGIAPSSGSGQSAYRKVIRIPDFSGWWDDNNTSMDFGWGEPSLKNYN